MRSFLKLLVALGFWMLLASCEPMFWNPNERTGVASPDAAHIERIISVPLNAEKPELGSFDLYYFVTTPPWGDLGQKTVLFCTGGPGQILQRGKEDDTFADFLRQNGFNVVYLHLRGSGFSQLPPSNEYDRYLKTTYAVEDIEKIRQHFLRDKKWDAVVGWSYGTVLAQQYAAKYQDKVGKLVLMAPLSEHKKDFREDERLVRRESLEKIYTLDEFKAIKARTAEIVDKVFGPKTNNDASVHVPKPNMSEHQEIPASADVGSVFKQIEDAFGSDQYVIDEYCDLKGSGELKNYNLERFSLVFFKQVRDIRLYGWKSFPAIDSARQSQVKIGKLIAVAIIPELSDLLGNPEVEEECVGEREEKDSSQRVLYVMRLNDGFISRSSAQITPKANKFIKKLKPTLGEKIEPWDPTKCSQDRPDCLPRTPTLVLKGGADPVTAGGQVEYVFNHFLRGPRTFIEFPGIGHGFRLPQVSTNPPFLSGIASFEARIVPPGVQRLYAKIAGLTLIKKIELIPPEELRSQVELVNSQIETANQVNATILNRGPMPVNDGGKDWTVSSPFFTAKVRLDFGRIPVGETATSRGTVADIHVHQQIQVIVPEELKSDMDLISASFSRGKNDSLQLATENRVSLEIRNKSSRPLTTDIAGVWNILNPFFTGVLRFPAQDGISPGRTRTWVGEIINIKVRKEIKINPPENLLSQLEIVSANLGPENNNHVSVTVKNNGNDPVSVTGRNWPVHSPIYSAVARLNLGKINANETVQTSGTITNARVRPHAQFEVTAPTLETGLEHFMQTSSIPAEDTLSVVVFNKTNNPVVGAARDWTFDSLDFTATARLEPKAIPGRTEVDVRGVFTNIQLKQVGTDKQTISLIPPNDLPYEFVSGSEQIEAENNISILVRNRGTTPLAVEATDWGYVVSDAGLFSAPVRERACHAKVEVKSRDCLIYAFIAMDYRDFVNPEKNDLLKKIKEKFSEEVRIKHCPRGNTERCSIVAKP